MVWLISAVEVSVVMLEPGLSARFRVRRSAFEPATLLAPQT